MNSVVKDPDMERLLKELATSNGLCLEGIGKGGWNTSHYFIRP